MDLNAKLFAYVRLCSLSAMENFQRRLGRRSRNSRLRLNQVQSGQIKLNQTQANPSKAIFGVGCSPYMQIEAIARQFR
jgi:hypothetical protein